jgi:flagellar assembly protein FliH
MTWPETIRFSHALQSVRLVPNGPAPDPEERVRNAERAAYQRGRRDAEKALGEQLLQQRAELAELQQGVLQSLRNVLPGLIQESEKILVDLALEAAAKVVAGLPINANLVQAVVREAIQQLEDTTEISVNLHPNDLALLRKHQSPILEGLPETGSIRFAASSEVTQGGCLVHTRYGLLDARRETKFEQLRHSIAQ